MKLSNFARCMIYVLSSICLGQTELQEGNKVGLGEAERTEQITVSPSTGEGYPTTADAKVEVDVRGTERTEFEKSVFHESDVDASVAEKKVDDNHRKETFEESGFVTTEIHNSSRSSEDRFHSVAVGRVEDEVERVRSDKSDTPKTAAGEMGHGVGCLSGVEKEFLDNFNAGSAGHWIELRDLSQTEIVNICTNIYKSENGPEAVAYYRAEPRPREFSVRLSDKQIEDLMTDVLQCNVETLQTGVENFKISTFYVAEGHWPNDVFKLKTSRHHSSENTLEVENRIAIVF